MPCQGRSESVLVYWEWTRADRRVHTGQRASRDTVLAVMVMAFASARTQTRFSVFGSGRMVRESGMSDLGDLLGLGFACEACRRVSSKARKNREDGASPAPRNSGGL